MSITILGIDGPISAGVGVTAICEVAGSRPTPNITWWLDGKPLRALRQGSVQKDNNITRSSVIIKATSSDQGGFLSCRAETPGLLLSVLEKMLKLEIHCKFYQISFQKILNHFF